MIFKLNLQEDSWLEKVYDTIRGTKTPSWLVGFGGRGMNGVYLLDRNNFEKESENTYSEERYAALLKHELAHCFTDILTKSYRYPIWLMEGLAIYLSNQLKWRKKPEKFSKFLSSFDQQREGVYSESGFIVKVLIEKYGKEKMIELLKQLSGRPDEPTFTDYFKNVYGIDLNYEAFM